VGHLEYLVASLGELYLLATKHADDGAVSTDKCVCFAWPRKIDAVLRGTRNRDGQGFSEFF
jgi:hypothetical protein